MFSPLQTVHLHSILWPTRHERFSVPAGVWPWDFLPARSSRSTSPAIPRPPPPCANSWQPHLYCLVTCGAFTKDGEFLEVTEVHTERVLQLWEEVISKLLVKEESITQEAVEEMRGWDHSGFSVDQSVHLPAGDSAGIEWLVQYMVRCPFSLARMVKVTDEGTVFYRSEKQHCRPFPDAKRPTLRQGTKRNVQILPALEFIAEFTQHIPTKGSHLVCYYGWYSNKARGMCKKAAEQEAPQVGESAEPPRACNPTWAMLRSASCFAPSGCVSRDDLRPSMASGSSSACMRWIRLPLRSCCCIPEPLLYYPVVIAIKSLISHPARGEDAACFGRMTKKCKKVNKAAGRRFATRRVE